MKLFKSLFFFIAFLSISPLFSQQPSLRINEVSQGTGTQEYVEFLVTGIPSTACSPQNLDLRGWIFDDNNGRFKNGAGTGIAGGSMRFSSNSIWQAVPVGTLILIYNDASFGFTLIPAQDLSLTDGNCRLVIPANSNLIEKNALPDQNSSPYPASGWSVGGNWTYVGMANDDDSFQIYAPTNTTVPVHAVSWGNNTLNNIIYFSGSAGGKVFCATNTTSTDMSLQSNWSSLAVNSTNQTPGSPNSPQNAAYISSLNNNCTIPTGGITVTASGTDVSCNSPCSGTASITISGGTAPYTVLWSNNATTNSISNLCAGTYSVTVTDDLGCDDTQTIVIGTDASFTLVTSGNVSICEGESTTISVSGATDYTWTQNLGTGNSHTVSPTTSITYNVTGTTNGCSVTETIVVTVNPKPTVTFVNENVTCTIPCSGKSTATISGGTAPYSILWSNNATTNSIQNLCAGNYSATVTDALGCKNTQTVTIGTNANFTFTTSGNKTICEGESTTISAAGATDYAWTQNLGTENSHTVSPATTTTYNVTGTTNGCSVTETIVVTVNPNPIINAGNDQVVCIGESYTFNATGGDAYVWSDGFVNGDSFIPDAGINTYTVVGTVGNCFSSDELVITVISCDWELELPNVFTPNGDQVNDFFVPTKESNIAIKEFNIFNRWGNLIYKSNAPILIWNGKTNVGEFIEDEVLNGVYFYVITFTNNQLEEKMEQGFVHVLR